ncbi:hypothetical protein MLD38_030138 [Melastoma candidum]|uniref:Uncharacterized protein n=1 Tax=Melastoma candidum TaxID=119954 RepID=A0ACB9MM07_9MYRT|nr:hypothetical protein MLD38_030138 [Melastoma candidum]
MDPPPPPLPTTLTPAAPPDPSTATLDHPRLRLMVSYGGHILPRPHDKSLVYVGGTTRLLLLDRQTSASSLLSRISRSLPLNSRRFTLKYQLPNDDLDSLVSLSSDEDLRNFLDEYDRLLLPGHSSSTPRIRLFLFFDRPSTAMSLGPLLERPDDEGWFLDALNSADHIPTLPPSLSDSAANAADLFFCEDDVGRDEVSKLAPAPIKVTMEDPDLDRAAGVEPSSDQGDRTGAQVHASHHKVAVTYNNLPSPDSVTSDNSSIASGSSLYRPTGSGQPSITTPAPGFSNSSALVSEPPLYMTQPPPVVEPYYHVTAQQTQSTLPQQLYGNASGNYLPQAAVTGPGQVFVQSYYPMYVMPPRANVTRAQVTRQDVTALHLPSSTQYLPHQQHNLPGTRPSQSIPIPAATYSFEHPTYNLFDQGSYYGQLPVTAKATPQYQAGADTSDASK